MPRMEHRNGGSPSWSATARRAQRRSHETCRRGHARPNGHAASRLARLAGVCVGRSARPPRSARRPKARATDSNHRYQSAFRLVPGGTTVLAAPDRPHRSCGAVPRRIPVAFQVLAGVAPAAGCSSARSAAPGAPHAAATASGGSKLMGEIRLLWAAPVALASLVAGGCASSREEPVGVQRQDWGPSGWAPARTQGAPTRERSRTAARRTPARAILRRVAGAAIRGSTTGSRLRLRTPARKRRAPRCNRRCGKPSKRPRAGPSRGLRRRRTASPRARPPTSRSGRCPSERAPVSGSPPTRWPSSSSSCTTRPNPAACTCDMLDAAYGVGAEPFPGGDTGVSHPISGQMQSVGVMPGPSSWMPPAGAACIAGDPRNNPT